MFTCSCTHIHTRNCTRMVENVSGRTRDKQAALTVSGKGNRTARGLGEDDGCAVKGSLGRRALPRPCTFQRKDRSWARSSDDLECHA